MSRRFRRRVRGAFEWLRRGRGVWLGFAVLGPIALGDARAAWPPPAGSAPGDPANLPDDYGNAWAFASTLPTRDGIANVDRALGASGMGIDAAWTYGVGSPDGVVAVLDTGIDWTATDLRKRLYLNAGELSGEAKPRSEIGRSCGGSGWLAGYDCDNDGRFTVADYDRDPRLSAPVPGEPCFVDRARRVAGPDRRAGDVNRNCVLDAGDLAAFFSDGVDDDANGYRDDIAGWDVFAGDNDPEAVESVSGTARALEVGAEGNNGEAAVGVCPDCRVLPVRVASSPRATGAAVGEALAFAVEAKATVALVGVELLSATPFVRSSAADAARGGTSVVLHAGNGTGRLRSQASFLPGGIVVGSVRYDGRTPATSASFVAPDACQPIGPSIDVVASADACNVQGAARVAGVLALVGTTMARSLAEVRPGELAALLRSTASNVGSDAERTRTLQAGWGRVNAKRAIEQAMARRFPPEIRVDRPQPFEWLDARDRGASVTIVGRASARLASRFDVGVAWAAGEDPREADFRELSSSLVGLPPDVVAGADDVPLATIDLRQIDATHTPDALARGKEESRSVTLRVRAVAHYVDGDVASEVRRVVTVTASDASAEDERLPGFPLHLGAPAESGPVVADVDGDGLNDIVLATADGRVHAFSLRSGVPSELPGFPYALRVVDALADDALDPTIASHASSPSYRRIDREGARETPVGSPLVADLDGDGRAEIVFASREGALYVVDRDGRAVPPWPRRLPRVAPCGTVGDDCADLEQPLERGISGAPSVFDFDADGRLELVVPARDGKVHAFRGDGQVLPGFPAAVLTRPAAPLGSALVIVPSDGSPRIVVATEPTTSRRPAVLALRPGMTGSTKIVDGVAPDAGVASLAASASGDLFVAFAFGGAARLSLVGGRAFSWPATLFGSKSTVVAPDELVLSPGSELAVADMDGDASLDLVLPVISRRETLLRAGAVSSRSAQRAIAFLSGGTGASLYGAPFATEATPLSGGAALGDVSGDGSPEAVSGDVTGVVHAVDGCGRETDGFPKVVGEAVSGTPALATFEPSQGVVVAVATTSGSLFAWRTRGDSRVLPWAMARANARGTATSASTPGAALDCRTVPKETQAVLSAGGCQTAPRAAGGTAAGDFRLGLGSSVIGIAGVATLLRRRREKRILRRRLPE